VKKTADALVSIIGFTNSGRSSLLSALTNATPKITEWQFTTFKPEQGVFDYGGCKIQVVELPPLKGNVEEDAENFGTVRVSDLVIITITGNEEIEKILDELKQARVSTTILIVHNKSDIIPKVPSRSEISVSSLTGHNIKELKDKIFFSLGLIRVYTKEPGKKPMPIPTILKAPANIKDLAKKIHKTFLEKFDYALVWGSSVKFQGQRCGFDHRLKDKDTAEIYLKK
jgi:hypothetical protein